VIRANIAGSVSKNPFFSFRLKNCQSGDRIAVEWRDNLGQTDRAETVIGSNPGVDSK
jgi:sulfur-oxidizing protein SoxZ